MEIDIPIFDWFEDPIKDSVRSVFNAINSKVESLDIFRKYRDTHFEILKSQVGSVKILGMQHPIELQNLYYPAVVSTDIRRRIYAPEWREIDGPAAKTKTKAKTSSNTEAGDKYIANNKRVIVLGGPGAGKTTFLKYLALAFSDKKIFTKTKLKYSLLPIFIHLPSVAKDGKEIFAAISDNLVQRTDQYAKDFFTRLLELGECIIFFDSLDEVPKDHKDSIISKLKAFADLYPKASIVISCRIADYDQSLPNFSEVELAKLSKEGVTSIVKAWFSGDKERSNRLLALLDNDITVASLTETPLLLSLLCIQFRNDLALPKRKTELFRRCVDALLRDWDTTRGFRRDTAYSHLSDDRKEKIFEAISGNLCNASITYEIREPLLLSSISDEISRFGLEPNEAKGILKEIENHHGILEKCSVETYEFSHATMQDYFAARYFVSKRQELFLLKKYYENEQWQNILAFMCSIMDEPTPLLDYLVERSSTERFQNYPAFGRRLSHLLLLYRCMAMGVSISPAVRTRVCKHLVLSQVHMIKQINKDGVLPYAARLQYGVRQSLYRYSEPRSSISKIMLPYRSLMNEIVLSPIPEYAHEAYAMADELEKSKFAYAEIGLLTCLLAPVSEVRPAQFKNKLAIYSLALKKAQADNVRSIVVESLKTHQQMFPSIFTEMDEALTQ